MNQDLEKQITITRFRLQRKSPFFATLSMFIQFKFTHQLSTAATNSKDIYINPEYFLSLSPNVQEALILHELLHAALLHPLRLRTRDRKLWNIAADIVVNLIIKNEKHFASLPKDWLLSPPDWRQLGLKQAPDWEKLSAEEVYELLLKAPQNVRDSLQLPEQYMDLIGNDFDQDSGNSPDSDNQIKNNKPNHQNYSQNSPDSDNPTKNNKPDNQNHSQNSPDSEEQIMDLVGNNLNQDSGKSPDSDNPTQNYAPKNQNHSPNSPDLEAEIRGISPHQEAELRQHWQNALQQAAVVARTSQAGTLPVGMERQISEISESQLDWRSYLWRYLVQTPNDFQGYDRRFIGRGLYLESLIGESVQVYVAIDTSGSINHQDLKMFISEVIGILNAYPHLKCSLYYADAAIYGPYDINKYDEIPTPQGGGGTSFIPFFQAVEKERDFSNAGEGVCVYLTDGYGYFPQEEPPLPTLWIVTPGGLDLKQFPFGEAVKLLSVS